jgi:glycosyltransferase involved in cell wall biosynthesis
VGADGQLATAISDCMADVDFVWFSRWPARGRPGLSRGRLVRILSRDGVPHLSERLQVAVAGARWARRTDLVHAVLTIGSSYPLYSRWQRRLLGGRPVIHTVPGVMEPGLLARSRPLGVTVALSEVTAQALRAAGFGDVRVIPPTVPLEKWPLLPRTPGLPTVLFAGHHDPRGGAVEAIRAAAAAAGSGARFRLVLAMRGRPGQKLRALEAELLALARREGLRDVEVRGHVPGMPELIRASDVLLFPAPALCGKADVPLTVLEMLATGRPVILSDLPQFAMLGDAVLRAPAEDYRQTGRLLAGLLEQPTRWQSLVERGRSTVEREFSPERFKSHYHALYREVLK